MPQVVFERMESDLHIVIESNDDLTHDHHKVSGSSHLLAASQTEFCSLAPPLE
jgi:hypothetical protein